MAQEPNPDNPEQKAGLLLRVGSALVLAPPILAALYFGPPYSHLLILVGAGLMAWEWAKLCNEGLLDLPAYLVIGSVVAAVAAGAFEQYGIGGWIIAAGAMAVAVAGLRHQPERSVWLALGICYLALACLAFQWLRADQVFGRVMVFWLFGVVWATDIGAYFFGRAIGGPKLAPAISPKKTWAGLIGGMACAVLVGLSFAYWAEQENYLDFIIYSAVLAVVSQIGDLFESSLKRRFGAKDSSRLIPGHGGVLDRADGLLAGCLVVAILTWLTGASS